MIDQETLQDLTESYLKFIIGEISENLDSGFDSFAPFGELGINSFYVLKIVKKLENDFGSLPKTLLFENFNINDLAGYFVKNHELTLSQMFESEIPALQIHENNDLSEMNGKGALNARNVFNTNELVNVRNVVSSKPVVSTNAVVKISDVLEPSHEGLNLVDGPKPLIVLEKDAYLDAELSELVGSLFEKYKNESSVSRGTKNIAPILFIGSEKLGYFNLSKNRKMILAYGYTGRSDYFASAAEELYRYCRDYHFELSIFSSAQIVSVGGASFSSTPFGVMQRILDIKNFTLDGKKMRRLRYQVSKFEKDGVCSTLEYKPGTTPELDQRIAEIIDQWCTSRSKVNPLIHIVKNEILAGTLHPNHRVFTTFMDDVLQNVILISAMSAEYNGYLMDLEFYPKDMPLGGLEFAIVKIIDTLVAEGCDMFSLGGTYGCKLNDSSNADPAIEKILDDLRTQNIFNDEGNLQFKNKFRPENTDIFLSRPVGEGDPDNVIDIIMMIADPADIQVLPADMPLTGSYEKPRPIENNQNSTPLSAPENVNSKQGSSTIHPVGQGRASTLAGYGFNPLNVPADHIDFDLKTDSWSELRMPAIERRMSHLHSQLQQPTNIDESIRAIFPFTYFALTTSGRTAEHFFYKAWDKKGTVPQNLLFPTCIFHQIDNGFTPKEFPNSATFTLDSDEVFRGNLCLKSLENHLNNSSEIVAFVCVELSDNAAGGYPMAMEHIKDLKKLLSIKSLPLVIDATRILENAHFVAIHEDSFSQRNIWDIAKEIFSYADAVIASLTKDFCINKGGLIATNDTELFRNIQKLINDEGDGLDVIDKKLIALSLKNRKYLENQCLHRMEFVGLIWDALRKNNVPVVKPISTHCILIDVKQIPEFARFPQPVASFLAWLYINTGIRAAAHNAGMQQRTSLNDIVRLAIPVGLKQEQIDEIIDKLLDLFKHKINIPELEREQLNAESFGDMGVKYTLVKFHNMEKLAADSTTRAASSMDEKSVVSTLISNLDKTAPVKDNSALSTFTESVTAEPIKAEPQDIAIIGMAGRYPKAKNLSEMWDNLLQSKNCIDDIPEDRFHRRRQHETAKKYRGGFMADLDKFDSLFFNIAPREAEMMDPQERLFLEVAWEALEDAGYYPDTVVPDNSPRDVGVFVGAVWAMYQTVGAEERFVGNEVYTNSFLWSIANRVSYCLNLTGPSIAVDTACSASLTAIYLACEAIQKGECSSAIVGGVNIDAHQCKQEITVAGGLLSEDGLCRTFGKGANGYVPGEGIGALYLKPLAKAIADGDNIQGLIKSVVINHGGKTSGYSVPNSRAQTELVAKALQKASIDARTIGYIEAHGTGTELGDPIEITGLTNAFQSFNVKEQSCAIGSIKSNIGHLEAAAGIVGVSKVLLQMKYSQLVPSLHSAELNDFIDFKNSPFYVGQKVDEWCEKEIDGKKYPLRAGISSFGAGGSNAHVILEKHVSLVNRDINSGEPASFIFPLSARTEEQLLEAARNLQQFLLCSRSQALPQNTASNIAHTLQIGRKSFDFRAAFISNTKTELIEKLNAFISGKKDEKILIGQIKNSEGITKLLNKKEKEAFVSLLSQSRDPNKLAQLWTEGLLTDWQGLRAQGAGQKVSLPTYPFADRRHWAADISQSTAGALSRQSAIHPLIDSNESTFERQIFKKTFTDSEFFIYDHLVSDIPTLPGVAYLDLARKAGEVATGRKVRKIKNILWVSPLTVRNSVPNDVYIELKPNGDMVQFDVYSEDTTGKKQLYSQGKLFYETQQEAESADEYVDLVQIRSRCEKVIDGKDAYPLFKSLGLNLGPSFQCLQEVFKNENEVLGVLKLPDNRLVDFQQFLLHPSLVDSSFQAAMGAQLAGSSGEMFVPYSLGEVEILHPLQPVCFSYVTQAKDEKNPNSKLSKANVFIVDESGKILVKVRDSIGVPLTEVHEKPTKVNNADDFPKLYYSNVWEKSPVNTSITVTQELESVLLFAPDNLLADCYRLRLQQFGLNTDRLVLVQPGDEYQSLGSNTYRINSKKSENFAQLIAALQQTGSIPHKICFAWQLKESNEQEFSVPAAMEQGVYSLLYLCQSLIEQKVSEKIQILYVYFQNSTHYPQPHNQAISGFAKTLQLENPKFICKSLEIHSETLNYESVLDSILNELNVDTQDVMTLRYQADGRHLQRVQKFDLLPKNITPDSETLCLKQKGVYVITGGAGGLGLIFAEYLAKTCKARLVLTGRSELSEARREKLNEFRSLGAEVIYVATDVAQYEQVEKLITEAKSAFGELNGIIHSAGVLRDSYIRNKTPEDMSAVLAPKISGALFLDEVTKDDQLDFFVMFSSLAALVGNAGQCDYAYANHFMDSFAEKRELLRHNGERFGKALSLNWSIWADGGMKLDEQTEVFFRKNLGIKPLDIETGIEAFTKGLASEKTQFAVLEGVQEKIEISWGLKKKIIAVSQPVSVPIEGFSSITAPALTPVEASGDLHLLVQDTLSKIVMKFLKLTAEDIDLDSILLDLGFDSIGLTTFANAINDKYKLDVTPVLFFEYPSIREISKYLALEHKSEINQVHKSSSTNTKQTQIQTVASTSLLVELESPSDKTPIVSFGNKKAWNPDAVETHNTVITSNGSFSLERRFLDMPIAIVGMSGVMPQSEDMEEYWDKLQNAEDMITVIPRDRWNWEDYDGDPLKEQNKCNSRWGGFMKEVDKFDPLFFGISPREAEMMDPQQRIFLETVWKTIEDAGHKVSDLSGTNTGLFVGAATHDYTDLMNNLGVSLDGYTASGNSHSVLVNRVSFLLNLRGPSAPLDTACSSSLIAIHRALESIHTGSCEMAIVGGVQVMLTPAAYISFGIAGMLSNDGKCKTFDSRADGYVRGEGSGAIFLKPLSMAEKDGNHIYAVIKSTAENHGGKVTFLTAPNPNAQAELLVEAYEKADVDPATVGYIECHGTGTSLGDPIEIQALKKSFAELYKKRGKSIDEIPHCGLSSVKSNIGHLETAAGIAGILKVLLAIKHKQIPATLHFEELNPYINLKGSPFYIVDKTQHWDAIKGPDGHYLPRRAGISSFGFGGANSHIVLEEYQYKNPVLVQHASGSFGPQLIVLSAKDEEQLKIYADHMLKHVKKYQPDLMSFAYTLQIGRDEMNVRLGFLVESLEDVTKKLTAYLTGDEHIPAFFKGKIKRGKDSENILGIELAERSEESVIAEWIQERKLPDLLNAWVQGVKLDWRQLHTTYSDSSRVPRRMSLPTYPFAKERYWFDTSEVDQTSVKAGSMSKLHPLLHANTSLLGTQSYSSSFSGKELFISDYRVNQNSEISTSVLPIAAYVETIRAALTHATSGTLSIRPLELREISWFSAFEISLNAWLNIGVYEKGLEEDGYLYELSSTVNNPEYSHQEKIHCQGTAIFLKQDLNKTIDLSQVQSLMGKERISADQVYATLATKGMSYGNYFKPINAALCGSKQLLIDLNISDASDNDHLIVSPQMFEGALQAVALMISDVNDWPDYPVSPTSIKSIQLLAIPQNIMHAWVRYSRGCKPTDNTLTFDIDIMDSHGKVCVAMKSLSYTNAIARNGINDKRSDFEGLLNSVNTLDMRVKRPNAVEDQKSTFEQLLGNIY
jgi:polyketide synthase PksN